MRFVSLALLALVVAVPAAGQAPKATDKPDIFAVNKALGRGVNFGNALEAPKEGDWGVKIEAAFFKLIKDAGFATVRVPVKWSAHAAKEAPYTIDAEFFNRIDWVLDRAAESKLHGVLTVHYYEPYKFTHQGAPWAADDVKNLKGVKWSGTDAELKELRKSFDQAAEWAKKNSRPVFLGEFGTYGSVADMDSRAKWTAAVA